MRNTCGHAVHILKCVGLTTIGLVKQAGLMAQSLPSIFAQRRQRLARAERETERLDRIRNPSKYLGQ